MILTAKEYNKYADLSYENTSVRTPLIDYAKDGGLKIFTESDRIPNNLNYGPTIMSVSRELGTHIIDFIATGTAPNRRPSSFKIKEDNVSNEDAMYFNHIRIYKDGEEPHLPEKSLKEYIAEDSIDSYISFKSEGNYCIRIYKFRDISFDDKTSRKYRIFRYNHTDFQNNTQRFITIFIGKSLIEDEQRTMELLSDIAEGFVIDYYKPYVCTNRQNVDYNSGDMIPFTNDVIVISNHGNLDDARFVYMYYTMYFCIIIQALNVDFDLLLKNKPVQFSFAFLPKNIWEAIFNNAQDIVDNYKTDNYNAVVDMIYNHIR
jgi:hypothetical protein